MSSSLTRQFYRQFPLLEGEEELHCTSVRILDLFEGEIHTIGHNALLILTNLRVGIACSRAGYSVKYINEVINLDTNWDEQQGILIFGEDDSFLFEFIHPQEFEVLWGQLFERRCYVVCPEGQGYWFQAIQQITDGSFQEAIQSLEAMKQVESYHPAPYLLSALLYRTSGLSQDTVNELLEGFHKIRQHNPFGLIGDLLQYPFSRAQLFRLSEAFSLESEPSELSAYECLLAAFVYTRKGEGERALPFIETILSDDEPMGVWLGAFYSLALFSLPEFPSLKALLQKKKPRWISLVNSSDMDDESRNHFLDTFDLFEQFFDFDTDMSNSYSALEELLKKLEIEADASTFIFREEWDQALATTCKDVEPPSQEVWEMSMFAEEAFQQTMAWMEHTLTTPSPEKIWTLLRLGRVDEAWNEVNQDPRAWSNYWRSIQDSRRTKSWLAGLSATELLLRSRTADLRSAHEEIEQAYLCALPGIKKEADSFFYYGSDLYGLYQSLCTKNSAAVGAYMQLLENSGNGFTWVKPLVQALMPAALKLTTLTMDALPNQLDQFDRWFQTITSYQGVKNSSDVQQAYQALQHERNQTMLRVVITGETSAGKTSFINALLGAEVLYITQKEATAKPTQIYRGNNWMIQAFALNGSTLDTLQFGTSINQEESERMRQFLEKYTSLQSMASQNVGWVNVQSPSHHIPVGVVYTDTPGLNAHGQRTAIAEKAVESAHACIFLFDGRNALKSREASALRRFSHAVGKTLFVLNKMDLVAMAADDDLDCEDEDAADEVIDRVRKELCKEFNVTPEQLGLFPVSSIPPGKLHHPEARYYAEQISTVRESLRTILTNSRERLLAHASAKVAFTVAQKAQGELEQETLKQEEEIRNLLHQKPDDPDGFQHEVFIHIMQHWYKIKDEYIAGMDKTIDDADQRFFDRIAKGLQSCENREQIKSFLKNRLKSNFRNYSDDIERAREGLWRSANHQAEKLFGEYLNRLYEELPFQVSSSRGSFHLQLQVVPLHGFQTLQRQISEKFSNAETAEWGGAAAGAAIGAVFGGPIGAVIGGVAGGWFGSQISEDLIKDAFNMIEAEFIDFRSKTIDILNLDINEAEDGSAPLLLSSMAEAIEKERLRFADIVSERLKQLESQRDQAFRDSDIYRKLVVDSMRWSHLFKQLPTSTFG